MPVWWVSEPFMNLWVDDEPLGYQPSVGPRVSFYLRYKQRENTAGYNTDMCNVGTNWSISWVSYVQDQGVGTGNYLAQVLLGKGGLRTMIADGTSLDYYTGLKMLRLTDTNANTTGFHVLYPDQSKDVYTGIPHVFPLGTYTNYFLTGKVDPDGNQLTFNYGTNTWAKLLSVVDADGRTNTVTYGDPGHQYLITSVTDPFGRSVTLSYNSGGLLTNITDVAQLTNGFTYTSTNVWMTKMITPYGTNAFRFTGFTTSTNLDGRSVEITEPDGSKQLYVYRNGLTSSFPNAYTNQVPNTTNANFSLTNNFDNTAMYDRNSFHWGREQYEFLSTNYLNSGNISNLTSSDYTVSHLKHWLKDTTGLTGQTLSLERLPTPGSGEGLMTWYDYEGKSPADTEGPTHIMPLFVARVLPDGTTQFTRTPRNGFGLATEEKSTYSRNNGTVDVRTTSYQYGATNDLDLVTITNPLSVQVSSNWFNSSHHVLTNYNALKEKTIWYYNSKQQIAGVQYPSGLNTTNTFNSWNQLIYTIDFAGSGTNTVYYSTNSYTYLTNMVATHTDEHGLTTSFYHDNLQRLIAEVDSRGTNSYSYDKLDLVRTVDRLGHTNSFGYNSLRQKIVETNALGTITGYDYCLCGSPSYVTNAVGNSIQSITQFGHDYQGRTTFVLYQDTSNFTYVYDALGRVTNILDSFGQGTTNYFNNQGLFVASSNYNGRIQLVTFDILDRATNVVDANGVTITNSYDNLDRLTARGYPDGGVERFVYTTNVASMTSYTNQLLSNVVNYAYDPLGRKTNEVYPTIATNSFAYDASGSLTTLIDGNNHQTTWTYDLYGRLSTKKDHNGTNLFTYTYYPTDWLSNRVDALSKSTTYSYNAAGNLTKIVYPSRTNSYAYDALSRSTSMVDTIGSAIYSHNYAYTSGGFLASEDGPWDNDTVNYSWSNRLPTGFTLLQPNTYQWAQNYGYDQGNRLQTVSSGAGTFTYTFKGSGNLVTNLALPNSSVITNVFDSMARLTGTYLKNSGGTILNSHVYGYDSANQRTGVTNFAGNYVNYSYYNNGALKTAVGKESGGTSRLNEQLTYAYDAAGNLNHRINNALLQTFNVNNLNELTTVTRLGTLTVAGTTSGTATNVTVNSNTNTALYSDKTFALAGFTLTNGNNAYTAIARDNLGRTDTNTVIFNLPATVSYTYDLNGNLTSDGSRGFDYDDENELIRVTVTNSWKSEFTYDGRMRRRIQKEFTWQSSAWTPTTEVRYIYDGKLEIQWRDGNNLPTLTLTRGRDLSGSLSGAGGIGGLLARTDTATAQPGYFHADGNGNITCLVNGGQIVVAKYVYDPFGNTLSKAGPLADANTFRFSSKDHHANSGLYYYGYRFYDPNLQRWLNRDPIEEHGDYNLYRFCFNGPTDIVDALGLDPNGKPIPGSEGRGNCLSFVLRYMYLPDVEPEEGVGPGTRPGEKIPYDEMNKQIEAEMTKGGCYKATKCKDGEKPVEVLMWDKGGGDVGYHAKEQTCGSKYWAHRNGPRGTVYYSAPRFPSQNNLPPTHTKVGWCCPCKKK
jgi:RHS repeat-associated protein